MSSHGAHEGACEKDILLADSLHRMKNLLGMVRAVALQTETSGRTAEEYREILLGRLEALLAAQHYITDGDVPELPELIRKTARSIEPDRLIIEPGPTVRLDRNQLQPVSMIFNELVTNAVKYGALSNMTGIVRVHWSLDGEDDGRRLYLNWLEEGGPVVQEPSHAGFGTGLITYNCSAQEGKATMSFDPNGLRVNIELPVAG